MYCRAILNFMLDVYGTNIVRDIDYPDVEATSVVLGYGAAAKKNASWTLSPLEEEITIRYRNVGK